MSKTPEKIISTIIEKMGVDYDGVDIETDEVIDSPRYVINSKDAALLIGVNGENLKSLRHILKKILEKGGEEKINFILDVGDYQKKKIDEIKNRATILGERAKFFEKNVEMPPMTAYERMVVHSALQNISNLKTESTGRGRERRVVIKYIKD